MSERLHPYSSPPYLLGSGGAAPSRFNELFLAMPCTSQQKTSVIRAATLMIMLSTLTVGNAEAASTTISGIAIVTDGDTLKINNAKIRIHGIDAPESKQTCKLSDKIIRCGTMATSAMKKLVNGHTVTCQQTDTDRYGRVVAICRAKGIDVGQRLVQTGWAVAYRRYSTRYVADEDAARAGKLGMWQGEFVKPWEWRRGVRLQPASTAADEDPVASGCRIKGNISKSGRIYHMPGSRWYDRTKVDVAKGEKWFCSAFEAEEAGWRAPR
jgi:endonuclease YncB( thermonuclease family)